MSDPNLSPTYFFKETRYGAVSQTTLWRNTCPSTTRTNSRAVRACSRTCKAHNPSYRISLFSSTLYFSTVLGLIALLMVLATLLEIAYSSFLPQDKPKPLLARVVLCFSPYSNLKGIAKTTDTNASGQIGCLNGMRQDSSFSSLQLHIKPVSNATGSSQ